MNKRIFELLKRATTNVNPEDREWVFSRVDQVKFAELIVKECSDLFEIEWGEEKLTGNDVGYVLKKHFGVEE